MIRRDVSNILGYTIKNGDFTSAFRVLDKDGRITSKHLIEIVALLLEYEYKKETSSVQSTS